MNIYLICPVRNATPEQIKRLKEYKSNMESAGHEIYYPADNNPYENTDVIGYKICNENKIAIQESDEVHIFWDSTSHGSLFDFGIAFSLNKPIKLINTVNQTNHKSFGNVLLYLNGGLK